MITSGELAALPVFATLADDALRYLERSVEDIRLVAGEYVANEGEERALFIVVEGAAEVTKVIDGAERVIGMRFPGDLFGEVPMTLSTPLPASCRATQDARILKLDVRVFYTLSAMAPQVAATVGAAALDRVDGLKELAAQPRAPELRVIGPALDAAVHDVQTFLNRNRIAFETVPPEAVSPATAGGRYPVVQLLDGTRLVAPSMRELAVAAGLQVAPRHEAYDVVIVGGGPAGLTAAVNAASEGLRTVLIERYAPGGQAGASSRIENYLGFPFGVSGDDLATRALQQARRLGAEIVVTRHVERIDPQTRTVTLDGGQTLHTRSIILALGVEWRRLPVADIDRFVGCGVYYGAARSDAGLAQGKEVYLVGAGNSAGQAAIFFCRHARSVTLLVRGESLGASMSQYLIDQIATKTNIRVETRAEVVGVHGDDGLEAIDVIDRRTGAISRRETEVLFVMIGADAATSWLPPAIARDAHGYVLTGATATQPDAGGREALSHVTYLRTVREPFPLETSAPGIFAVGDVRASSVKRVAAGVGEGGMVVSYVHQYLPLAP